MAHAHLLPLLILAAPTFPGSDDPVATLRWTHSIHDVYVRGTVPVPDGVDPNSTGWSLVHPTRPPIAVQFETVIRGPKGATEVIEVIARIPASEEPLRWARLVPTASPGNPSPLPAPHTQLPVPLRLRARDATGILHEASIAPGTRGHIHSTIRKKGAVHRQDRHALVMLPAPEAGALHPHLFGVHAYLGNWSGTPFLTLDLRIHNGLISPHADPHPTEAPVGPLYFASLELVLPAGWTASSFVADPALGSAHHLADHTILPLVREQPDNLLHLLPPGSRFHRRLVLYPTSNERAARIARAHLKGAGRAICVPKPDQWSWSHPDTARYFPQREQLPDLAHLAAPTAAGPSSFLARLRLADGDLARRIRRGSPGAGLFSSASLGWAHPWFRPQPGGHGGEGITFLEGLRAIASGDADELRRLQLLHRANASRHPTAAWRADGQSTHVEDWLDDEDTLPFAYHLVAPAHHLSLRLPCEGGPKLSTALTAQLEAGRRPPYDRSSAWDPSGSRPTDPTDLLAWHPHDGAHLIRFTAHAKALAWLCNDSLAIDSLLHEAERVRFALPNVPSSAPRLTTLHQLSAYASDHPHHGLPIGRELGWALDTTAAAYALGDPATRARLRPWILSACRLLVQGTPATGVPIRNDHSPLTTPRTHATAHSFQTAILHLGLRSASRSCLRGVDDDLADSLDALLLSAVETLFHGPVFHNGPDPRTTWPSRGDPSGPRWIFPVAPLDWSAPPYTPGDPLPAKGFDGGVETHYAQTLLAWAHRLDPPSSGQPSRHRDRILDLGPRYPSWSAWIDHLARRSRPRPGLDPLSQAAPAMLLAP